MKKLFVNLFMLTLIFRISFYDKELKIKREGRVAGWAGNGSAIVDVRDKHSKNGKNLCYVDWEDIKDWSWENVKDSELIPVSSTSSTIVTVPITSTVETK